MSAFKYNRLEKNNVAVLLVDHQSDLTNCVQDCQFMSWSGAACELHRDWRNDIEGLGALFSNHLPSYRCLIASYMTGKTAAKR